MRQAIAELVVEGLLVRTQGSGTYVAEPRLVHIRQLSSFTDDLGEARVGSQVSTWRSSPPPVRPRSASGSSTCAGSTASLSTGCRSPTSRPASRVSTRASPPSSSAGARSTPPLRDVYGVELQAVEDTVQTHLADPVTAELLGIETGHPLLLVHRLGRGRRAGAPSSGRARPTAVTGSGSSPARRPPRAGSPASLRFPDGESPFRRRRVSVSQTASRGSREAQRPSPARQRRVENRNTPCPK